MRIVLLLVALTPPLALANHTPETSCGPDGNVALGTIQIGTDPQATFYVDDHRGDTPVHVYQETNGAAGLQRGGSHELLPQDGPTCADHDPAGPDYHLL